MNKLGVILLAGVFLLGGCAAPADREDLAPPAGQEDLNSQYDTAMAKCTDMASEAMPNGMKDPNKPDAVLDSEHFCVLLAGGYSREKFAELYNDPEWLANELDIWSGEGLPK